MQNWEAPARLRDPTQGSGSSREELHWSSTHTALLPPFLHPYSHQIAFPLTSLPSGGWSLLPAACSTSPDGTGSVCNGTELAPVLTQLWVSQAFLTTHLMMVWPWDFRIGPSCCFSCFVWNRKKYTKKPSCNELMDGLSLTVFTACTFRVMCWTMKLTSHIGERKPQAQHCTHCTIKTMHSLFNYCIFICLHGVINPENGDPLYDSLLIPWLWGVGWIGYDITQHMELGTHVEIFLHCSMCSERFVDQHTCHCLARSEFF